MSDPMTTDALRAEVARLQDLADARLYRARAARITLESVGCPRSGPVDVSAGRAAGMIEDLRAEVARLTAALAAAQAAPVVEWRKMLDGRTGEVTTYAAEVGVAALRVAEKQWRARSFPGWKGEKPGWAVVFGMKYVAASGPETGDAGKAAAEAAYRRACGFPTAPPCAG